MIIYCIKNGASFSYIIYQITISILCFSFQKYSQSTFQFLYSKLQMQCDASQHISIITIPIQIGFTLSLLSYIYLIITVFLFILATFLGCYSHVSVVNVLLFVSSFFIICFYSFISIVTLSYICIIIIYLTRLLKIHKNRVISSKSALRAHRQYHYCFVMHCKISVILKIVNEIFSLLLGFIRYILAIILSIGLLHCTKDCLECITKGFVLLFCVPPATVATFLFYVLLEVSALKLNKEVRIMN